MNLKRRLPDGSTGEASHAIQFEFYAIWSFIAMQEFDLEKNNFLSSLKE